MRFTGILALMLALLLQGCSEAMAGIRIAFPIVMFIVVIGALVYAIYGNRKVRRSDNDPRRPDGDDRK